MMTYRELYNFLWRRYKYDTKSAFLARVLRFGVISVYSYGRNKKIRNFMDLSNKLIVVDMLNGLKMTVDTKDKGISADLYLDRTREPYIAKVWIDMLDEDDIVVDIGANIGYYAVPESKRCKYVYAIEPIEGNRQLLMTNISNNHLRNIEVYALAMGDTNSVDFINVSTMRNMCSMIHKQGYREYVDRKIIKVKTLDTLMLDKPYPTAIRMDVEGYELQVLKGMNDILKSHKPLKMFIEVHFDILMEHTKELLDILKQYGFEVKYATYECHPAVINHKFSKLIVGKAEQMMGAKHGYLNLKIDDMYRREFVTGQVEDLEVVFTR